MAGSDVQTIYKLRNEDDNIISIRNLFITEDDKDDLCIICYNNLPNITLVDCGHENICENCFTQINKKCPYCRSKITHTFPRIKIIIYYVDLDMWGYDFL